MKNTETCDIKYIHEDKVEDALLFLQDKVSVSFIELISAIGDTKKAVILISLFKEGNLCVCDLAKILKMSIASTSHHLRTLYKKDIVDFKKDGKMANYYIKDEKIKQLLHLFLEVPQ